MDFYLALSNLNLAAYSGALEDKLLQYYNDQNVRTDTCLEDAAYIYYTGLAYIGSLDDMIYQKAKDDGTI